jgi:2-amino-4-hydroxy-6-hydroxymethyldihydropteridine diphosphokinase
MIARVYPRAPRRPQSGGDDLVERRVRAYVGLGSNVGDPWVTLARAVARLAGLAGARVRGVSSLYVTTPVGVRDQPDFLNAAAALDIRAGPDPESGALALLVALKAIERDLGRTVRRRWGPREVDLDLLLYGRHTIRVERPTTAGKPGSAEDPGGGATSESRLLEVPHHDVAERLFVLAPLSELAPRLVPPGWRETVGSARRRREAIEGMVAARPVGDWDVRSGRWIPRSHATTQGSR